MRTQRAVLSTASAFAMTLAFVSPAFAQPADQSDPPETLEGEVEIESGQNADCAPDDTRAECAAAAQGNTILVTGSRIRRPTLESNVPVTSVGPEELIEDATVSLGDALNDLPALRTTFGSSNSQRFIGTTGLSLLDLRGLGTSRTLILVNGRRHVTANAGSFEVDVNTIPFELLERVDVVTGGSSAVYGSDAIAGVVNFILRRDFDGIHARGQSSISSRGDRGSYFGSIMAGRNFADGRANIAVVAEYSKANEVLNTSRPEQSGAFFGFNGFVQTDTDPPGTPNNSDGVFDFTFQNNVRYNFISEGGTLTTACVGGGVRQPITCPGGRQSFFRFDSNGRLVGPDRFDVDFRDNLPSSFAIGGTGSTLSDYGTLFPDIERMTVNVLAHFDVAEAFRPFIEAKFARLHTESESSPSFTNSFCGGLFGLTGVSNACDTGSSAGVAIGLDNPFLDPQDAALIRAIQTETILAAFPNTAAGRAAAQPFINRISFFRLNRNNLDIGVRQEDNRRDTWRVVGGFDGTFNDDWRYEVSATYGRFDARLLSGNNVLDREFRQAIDAVRAPDGRIVCRVNADADPNNDDPRCVPFNPFGSTTATQAVRDYVTTTSLYEERASQFDVTAYVNGDTSDWFEMPGGPARFVVGAEYRRERSRVEVDELTRTGRTFLTALQPFDAPTMTVKEIFGEIQLPVLRDMPFFQELEFTAAARHSDYNEGAGRTDRTFAYNLGLTWSPVRDLRFRGNYSQAVRAPTPGALFSEQGQNFAFLTDPCDARVIANGPPQRLENCRSNTRLGNVPPDYTQPSGNRSILQGGNPLLEEETSRSFTLGAIWQPRFIPGFSFTIDYYDIEVEDVIANPSATAILTQCYDSTTFPNNQFCDLVGSRQPGGFLDPVAAVTVGPVNFAALVAQGIDFDAAYRRTLGNGDRLTLRGIATWNLERTNYLDPIDPTAPNRVRSELGDPEWAANFNASYRRGVATFAYGLRYIGEQYIGTFETQNAYNGAPPLNPDAYEEVTYPAVFYHDVRLEIEPENDFQFYMGVDNLLDRLPPLGLTGAGAGSGIYDNVGRVFYAGARVNF